MQKEPVEKIENKRTHFVQLFPLIIRRISCQNRGCLSNIKEHIIISKEHLVNHNEHSVILMRKSVKTMKILKFYEISMKLRDVFQN